MNWIQEVAGTFLWFIFLPKKINARGEWDKNMEGGVEYTIINSRRDG
jgi:hypothetical protein